MCIGWWGFLSKHQPKSMISKHCQSTYHDTLSSCTQLCMRHYIEKKWKKCEYSWAYFKVALTLCNTCTYLPTIGKLLFTIKLNLLKRRRSKFEFAVYYPCGHGPSTVLALPFVYFFVCWWPEANLHSAK